MSSVKNPTEKKRLSLDRDRRNVFSENDKASRKNIPRAKQRSHMNERRSVAQKLSSLSGHVEDEKASDLEFSVKLRCAELEHRAFKKMPDKSLREFIERQKSRETRRQNRARNEAHRKGQK